MSSLNFSIKDLLEFTVSAAVSVFTYKVIFPSTPEVRVRKTNSSLSIHHSLFLCSVCLTPVAAHRLSMKYERHDIFQGFLANLTMRNKTRVLSFTVTRANRKILPRPFSACARPSSASVSQPLKVVGT